MNLLMEGPSQQWEPVLKDGWAIAAYIASLSSDDVDEEYIFEHYRGCRAVLRMVPVAKLTAGDADHNIPSKAKARRYAKLALDTMPPLVVEDGQIMDGNHRFRDAIKKGATDVPCYVVEEAAAPANPMSAKQRKKLGFVQEAMREGFAQQRVHRNTSIAALKALAKNNVTSKTARFIIDDGELHGADAEEFTHYQISPQQRGIRGWLIYHGDDTFTYKAVGIFDMHPADDPLLRSFERQGIEREARQRF